MMRSPLKLLKYGPKFAYYVPIGGLNTFLGRDSRVPRKRRKVICMGKCTKQLAKKKDFAQILGCLPKLDNTLKDFAML